MERAQETLKTSVLKMGEVMTKALWNAPRPPMPEDMDGRMASYMRSPSPLPQRSESRNYVTSQSFLPSEGGGRYGDNRGSKEEGRSFQHHNRLLLAGKTALAGPRL